MAHSSISVKSKPQQQTTDIEVNEALQIGNGMYSKYLHVYFEIYFNTIRDVSTQLVAFQLCQIVIQRFKNIGHCCREV